MITKYIPNPTFGKPMTIYTTTKAAELLHYDRSRSESPELWILENESGTTAIQISVDEIFDFESASDETIDAADIIPDSQMTNLLMWAEGEEIMEHQK